MAEIGPGLQKVLNPFPKWLQDQFRSEGDHGPAAFSLFAYDLGYGKSPAQGLPTDQRALATISNPNDPFWFSSPQRQQDHDKAVTAAQDWLKRANIKTTVHWTLGPLEVIAKIPILGPVLKAYVAPITSIAHIAEGQPLGQAALDNFKSQVGAIKAVGPYASTVVSFVPGLGTGVAAALSAGTALAEGKPIDQALEEGIRGAIPGGALAQAGFDMARKIASGENVGRAALETARAQLPAEAQKAFDVGLAVVSGKQLQSAITSAIASMAPDEVKQILTVGTHVVQTTPGLSNLASSLPSDAARQGLQLASGALAHAGINESQIRAMRSRLTGDVLSGFDAALKSQAQHTPWLGNIVEPAPPSQGAQDLQKLAQLTPDQQKQLVDLQALSKLTPEQQQQLTRLTNAKTAPPTPKPPEPASKAAPKPPEPTRAASPPKPPEPTRAASPTPPVAGPFSKLPYPHARGTVSAPPPHHGTPVRRTPAEAHYTPRHQAPIYNNVPYVPDLPDTPGTCHVWGAPVALSPHMFQAARSALVASRGNPTMVRGPSGVLYLFAVENGAITARPCASMG